MSEHIKSINDLIPIAIKEANHQVAMLGKETEIRIGVDGKPFNWDFFTEFYHATMDRMTIEKGLRVNFNNQ